MTTQDMQNVRNLPPAAASLIMLATIGALLRIEYSSMLQDPLPERLRGLASRM